MQQEISNIKYPLPVAMRNSDCVNTGVCSVTPEQPDAAATHVPMCVLTRELSFRPASLPLASQG